MLERSHCHWNCFLFLGNQVLLWTQRFAILQNLTSIFAAMLVFRYVAFSFSQLMLSCHHFGIYWSTIYNLKRSNFWFCLLSIKQGTSRPTHYHVLYDENNFPADALQILTNNLCYTYVPIELLIFSSWYLQHSLFFISFLPKIFCPPYRYARCTRSVSVGLWLIFFRLLVHLLLK